MSVNINHQTNNVQVGAALTLGHTQGLQYHTQSLHTDGFEVNNINASGIVTAGIVTANTIEVSGISTFSNEIDFVRPNTPNSTFKFFDFYAGTAGVNRVGYFSVGTTENHLTLAAWYKDLHLAGHGSFDTVITTTAVNGSYYGSVGRTAVFTSDGTAQLWYQDVKKFETTGSGVKVTGIATATGFSTSGGTSSQFLKADGSVDSSTYITSADGGDAATLDGIDSTSFLRSDAADTKSSGDLTFSDNVKLNLGSSGQQDSSIYHDGTDTIFNSRNGDIILHTIDTGEGGSGDDIIIKAGTGKTSIFAHNNGAVELWNNGSKKLETTGAGVTITGVCTATSFVKTGGTSSQYLMADGSVTTSGGGGGSSNSFETIAVSGQSDVVADSATDTLTLVAGSNMTITTNASGDSITFASSGSGGGGGVSQEESIAFAIALG